MKRWQSIGLGVVISIATLAYALHGNDLNQLGSEFARGRYIYVIPCFALFVVGFWFRALRWRSLLKYRMNTTHSFHITNISYFLNSFLPFRLGEVARAFLTTRLTPPIALLTSASSLVVERLTDLVAVMVVLLWAISLNVTSPSVESAARITGILAVGGMAIAALFAARRSLAHQVLNLILHVLPFLERFNLRTFTDHLLDGLAPLASIQGLLTALFWTALAWICSVTAGFFLLHVFYDQPTWGATFLMIASATIAVAVPAVPGNVGPFEAATIAGLTIAGMVDQNNPPERATAFGVLLHFTVVLTYTVLGLIGLSYEKISLGELIRATRRSNTKSDISATEKANIQTERQEGVMVSTEKDTENDKSANPAPLITP